MNIAALKDAYIDLMASAAAIATAPKGNPTTSSDLKYFQKVMEKGAGSIAEVLDELGEDLPSPKA